MAAVLVLPRGYAFARAVGVDGSFLTREPQVALDGKLYAGAISNLGALVWMLAAVMAFVAHRCRPNPRTAACSWPGE